MMTQMTTHRGNIHAKTIMLFAKPDIDKLMSMRITR